MFTVVSVPATLRLPDKLIFAPVNKVDATVVAVKVLTIILDDVKLVATKKNSLTLKLEINDLNRKVNHLKEMNSQLKKLIVELEKCNIFSNENKKLINKYKNTIDSFEIEFRNKSFVSKDLIKIKFK